KRLADLQTGVSRRRHMSHLFVMKLLPTAAAASAIIMFQLAQCAAPSQRKTLSEMEKTEYLEKGKTIAGATFAALSSRLTAALEEGGVANAVQYCNLVALPLTDSLSKENNAVIRRTSLQLRNLQNAPSDWEQILLHDYQANAQAGKEIKPTVQLLEDSSVAFAAPILAAPLCLKCHGKTGETMTAADYSIIQKLYPQDQATGYSEGDLRGMWSITFK
ncbi:MAG: DUF3365 domain-containing protein, partial [Bacteroidota bacterium]